MKKHYVWILLFIFSYSLLNGAEKITYPTLAKGFLKIGASFNSPPFVQFQYGRDVGFEVDLMNNICRLLKLKGQFIQAEGNQLFQGLENQQFDVIIGGLVITEDQQKSIEFSTPYMDAAINLVTNVLKNPSIKSAQDLKDKVLGVQANSVAEKYAQKMLNEHLLGRIMVYPNGKLKDAIQDLEKGQINAFLAISPLAYSLSKSKRSFKIIATIPNIREQLAIGLSKKNPALVAGINSALETMQKDGSFKRLYTKWFQGLPQN